MKRFLLFLLLLCPLFAFAEFVNVNCVGRNIPATFVVDSFPIWYNIGNTTFALQKEETDNFGIRHQFYQQYLDGTEVEGCILVAHSKDDIITFVNGDIMQVQAVPETTQNVSLRKAKKIASQSVVGDPEKVIVHTTIDNQERFFIAYKIFTSDSVKYVDVNTGDVVKALSLRRDATVCSGKTEFSGTKSFECNTSSSTGNYILYDPQRNIKTFYANIPKYKRGTDNGTYYSCSSTNWTDRYLTSITLEGFGSKWWTGNFGDNEEYPQIYIEIYNASNTLIYRSDVKDFDYTLYHTCPVTFNIGKMIRVPSMGGLTIKVYDDDTLVDDLGMTVSLASNTLGDHSWGNSSSKVWGYLTITDWHPALDIYWGQSKVYDYYLTHFNRNSFDNNGTILRSIMHDPTASMGVEYNMSNEYWNASAMHSSTPSDSYMLFGLGGDLMCNFVVAFDIIAHEYTHLISAFRPMGDLEYKGESGALNESMSDIMAMNIVHHYDASNFNWKLGENMKNNGQPLRDFENPKRGSSSQPSCYQGPRWKDPSSSIDNGGVHYNSGVSNHWYYLLCEGGSGYNDLGDVYSVQAIGMDTAEQVVFNTLLYSLPQQATFKNARTLTIQTAQQLYPSNPHVATSIADAWDAVGVYDVDVARQQFGLLVNGIVEHTASKIVAQDAQGRDQYIVSDIYLQVGDVLTCLDVTNNTSWVISNLDPHGSYQNFTANTRGIECQVSGCYSVYLKLAHNDDVIYIEPGNNCEEPDFVFAEGKYVIVTNRDKDDDKGWYYMTSNLGTASNKRYQAVPASDDYDLIAHENLDPEYIWELLKDGNKWKLKNGSNYSNWTSGNTANFNATGMQISVSAIYENIAYIHFFDGTNERYLSLNGTTGNNYFAYYKEKTQVPYLYFIPYTETIIEEPEERNCLQLPYTENFASSQGDFTIENVALDGLSRVWQFASGYGMKASAYVSNTNHPTESWLISPCLEMPESGPIKLTFDHVYRYTTTPTTDLTLFVSEDYESGAPSTGTWTPVTIPTYSSGSNWTFVNAGDIDLSAYAGKYITLGFRYKSSATASATWEIKNVSVTTSSNPTGVENTAEQHNAQKILHNGRILIQRGNHTYDLRGAKVK